MGLRCIVVLACLFAGTTPSMTRDRPVAPEPGCHRIAGGYRCFYGPFDVRHGSNTTFQFVAAPGERGYITTARATLVDRRGERIPRHMVHLHHAVWANPTKDDLTCPGLGAERFFGSGKERTKMVLPEGHGYFWSNRPSFVGRGWYLSAELDGMHPGMVTTSYVRLDLGYTPAREAQLTDVDVVWLDARSHCTTDPTFDVARGSGNGRYTKSNSYVFPVDGRFIAMAGHLHDGGIKLRLRNVTRDRPIFVSRALYDNPWDLTGMTRLSRLPGKRVHAGDRLELTAVYDSDRRWDDVMGIMVGAFSRSP